MDIENITEIILPRIKKYINDKKYNIKITIGKYSGSTFDKKLFQDVNYNNIKSLLESCNEWSDITDIETTKVKDKPVKIFHSIVIKFQNSPYDAIIEVDSSDKNEIIVSDSYQEFKNIYDRKHHLYEISKIKDNFETNHSFSLLLKNDIKSVSGKYLIHSSLLKIQDIINSCEKIDKLKGNVI